MSRVDQLGADSGGDWLPVVGGWLVSVGVGVLGWLVVGGDSVG